MAIGEARSSTPAEHACGDESNIRRVLPIIPGLLATAVLIALSWWGADWGSHWDERHNKMNAVAHSIESGFRMLPVDGYHYGGLNYWLTFACLAPELITAITRDGGNPHELSRDLVPFVKSDAFLVRVRRVYALLTALTPFWVYCALLVSGARIRDALFGAALLSLSFEVVSNARIVEPDTLLMQFAGLVLLLVLIARRRHSLPTLYAAAFCVALAVNAKYTGGLLMLPVFTVLLLWRRALGVRSVLLHAVSMSILATVVTLLLTPGIYIEPLKFYESIRFLHSQYSTSWYGYSVGAGPDHLLRILRYLGLVFFSPSVLAAGAVSALAIAGVALSLRTGRIDTIVLLAFPVTYLAYFSAQRAMLVRNYMPIAPFVAFFAARGFAWSMQRAGRRWVRVGILTAVVAILSYNLVYNVRASASVADRANTHRFLRECQSYVANRPGVRFLLSRRVAEAFKADGFLAEAPSVSLETQARPSTAFDEYLAYYSEIVTAREKWWPSNQPHTFAAVFGPRDIDLDYNAGWWGDDRIVSLRAARAREIGVTRPRVTLATINAVIGFPIALHQRAPLLSSGLNLAGDVLWAMRLDDTHVQLAWEHWGGPVVQSPAISIDPDAEHTLHVRIDYEGATAEVSLDGARVISYSGPLGATLPEDIVAGQQRFRTDAILERYPGPIREVSRNVAVERASFRLRP